MTLSEAFEVCHELIFCGYNKEKYYKGRYKCTKTALKFTTLIIGVSLLPLWLILNILHISFCFFFMLVLKLLVQVSLFTILKGAYHSRS